MPHQTYKQNKVSNGGGDAPPFALDQDGLQKQTMEEDAPEHPKKGWVPLPDIAAIRKEHRGRHSAPYIPSGPVPGIPMGALEPDQPGRIRSQQDACQGQPGADR